MVPLADVEENKDVMDGETECELMDGRVEYKMMDGEIEYGTVLSTFHKLPVIYIENS